ncbi:MAG: hypothetical protein UU77_C0070G0001, partial [candidate division WWE3 bacterium GW2011_GWC1_41_7]
DIKKPTLIIEGLNDKVFPPEVARKLNKNIIKSKLVLIPKANHIIVINNPKEIVKELITFLMIL